MEDRHVILKHLIFYQSGVVIEQKKGFQLIARPLYNSWMISPKKILIIGAISYAIVHSALFVWITVHLGNVAKKIRQNSDQKD